MREFILLEKQLHPMAQPQDYIKLIFQSEFGPGHLIADSSYAYNRLVSEWEDVKDLAPEESQPIGDGYIRLCIKGIGREKLEEINAAFVQSANNKTGTDDGFMEKINLLLAMAKAGELPFTYSEADTALQAYFKDGIRPTSHTKIYHQYYHPAYRVVRF